MSSGRRPRPQRCIRAHGEGAVQLAQTLAYFAWLGRQHGETATVRNLGQGAFQTDNGSAVVRKDWKILTVDISGLPAQFGKPPTSRGDVAVTVADLILACWAGD